MTVSGVGIKTSILASRILDLQSQFDSLQTQLATGKKSNTYAGMGVNRGFAVALRAQVSSIDAFSDTMTNVTTRINVANAALTRIVAIGTTVQGAAVTSSTQITSNGQTIAQGTARSSLDEMLSLLNSQSGDRYLFSGRATDTPATAISLTEDTGPFGLKLASITSSAASVTTTGPTGSPATESLDLGATNLSSGDTITLAFNLPDGTSENVQLTATAATLNAALTTAVGGLANGALVAATALKASSEFFSGSPVPRVGGPPFATATAQVPGTAANTLSWYNGETGTDPARGTAVARVDDGITVQYGARANEPALTAQLQTIAAMAAMSTTTGDPNASAQIGALYQRVATKLLPQTGQQSVQDIAADFAGAQAAMKSATDRQTQTKNTAETMLQSIEGVTDAEVTAKLLAVQNSLNASYRTTAMLYQTSLLKYL